MLTVRDNEKEYCLSEWKGQLIVQDLDLEDGENFCEVAEKDFSDFERSVYVFLTGESNNVIRNGL